MRIYELNHGTGGAKQPVMAVLSLLILMTTGCLRAPVIPTAKPSITSNVSAPRPYDRADVLLEKDPTQIYRIGARDILRIDVRKEPSLSESYTVTAEGNILLPNIGPIRVMELTGSEIEDMLNQVLAQYIREPEVTVGIQEYNSKVIYVVGQVSRPGPQIMRADMLTLQEAIFGAGLPTSLANLHRTRVITPDVESPIVRQINLGDIIYKGKMAENILLSPDDIVYVPSKVAGSISQAIRDVLRPVDDVASVRFRATFDNN
jgi:protein involved in polysaccharide export with SLBB domain